MGIYSSGLSCVIRENFNEDTIWSLAEKQSIQLHRRVRNNEELSCVLNVNQLVDEIKTCQFEDKSDLFTISNVGALSNTLMTNVIQINEHYVAMPCMEKRFSAVFFSGICSVNKGLCWSLSYNEKYFHGKVVDDLKLNILSIINNLTC